MRRVVNWFPFIIHVRELQEKVTLMVPKDFIFYTLFMCVYDMKRHKFKKRKSENSPVAITKTSKPHAIVKFIVPIFL
jgi:hypothetical protein